LYARSFSPQLCSLDLVLLNDKVLQKRLKSLRDKELRKLGIDPLKVGAGDNIDDSNLPTDTDGKYSSIAAAALETARVKSQATNRSQQDFETMKILEALKWAIESKMQADRKGNVEERYLRMLFLEVVFIKLINSKID
jgi:hypothetical protein